MKSNSKRKIKYRINFFLRRFLLVVFLIFIVWYFNNMTIKLTDVNIESSKINSSIKIAVISDFHYDRISVSGKKVYKTIQKQIPDLIFVLGDMYSRDSSSKDIQKTTDFIISLADICTVYFVPGEHDNQSEYIINLKNSNVNVMDYKQHKIWVDGNQLEIYGIDNVYFSETFDLKNEFQPPDKNIFSILLAHIPMYSHYRNFGTDLTICGDTHGGIVQIPFIGCAYYNGEWFPELRGSSEEVYDKGLFEYSKGNMFITSGLGNYPVPARFNNRPEVAVINLLPE